MNWLNIIIIILVGLFAMEILKHLFIKKIYKTLLILILIIVSLLIFSFYASKNNPNNQAITAGATIVDSAKDLTNNFDINEIKTGIFSELNKQTEETKKTLSKIQND